MSYVVTSLLYYLLTKTNNDNEKKKFMNFDWLKFKLHTKNINSKKFGDKKE